MDPERIDLSVLDPSRDAKHWERLVRSIATRGIHARRRPRSVQRQLLAWRLPAFGLAAGLAAAVWLVSALFGAPASGTSEDPAFVLARWAMQDEIPEGSDIQEIVGGADDTR